ncbi:hypothetical protein N7535_002792 [Penicillium sp. DV-2018c]|nr:hypothetical protein N7535_002792 [Penicillium sp. DV-2018c]
MADKPSHRYLYRCFSESSAGTLRCGLNRTGTPLSKWDLLFYFKQHMILDPEIRTALVSATDRPIEALHRAFVKYYNLNERAGDIWIAIISVPVGENDTLPYHHAVKLALELGYSPEERRKFMHEYIFEWEIEYQYVEHMTAGWIWIPISPNDRLPDLRGFRGLMIDMILDLPLDGYSVGRELGRMARCFGARAPVKEIANSLLTDCPTWISVNEERQNVKWTITEGSDNGEYRIVSLEDIDFEHFYWISQGMNEVLSDSWLQDSDFIQDCIAHAELANDLTAEMEILWELYWDNLYFEVWNGVNSDPATDEARTLQSREQEIHDLIERHAVSIGL